MNSVDKILIKHMVNSIDWCDLYQLHEKCLLSPGQLSRSLRGFIGSGIVEIGPKLSARPTAKGRLWVLANRRQLFLSPVHRRWAESISKAQVSTEQSYVPRMPPLNGLNRDFFVALSKGLSK